MQEIWTYAILAALAVVVVLVALALGRLAVLAAKSDDFERDVKQDLANARTEQAAAARGGREELGDTLARQAQATQQQLTGMAGTQNEQLKHFGERLAELTKSNEARLEAVRATVEQKLDALRTENTQKLEQMRATVDEKLQTTLDQRLGASFKQVSDRLEQVHKGLGEMQTLAVGVGDLKRVLTNVKRRGTWGEMQLGTLLREVLTPGQYGENVETIPGTGKRVEFAIRMPGTPDDAPCWIPVDSKFPNEEWERLQDALERADGDAAESARKLLAGFLRQQARLVRMNYISPPHTSDFAFLFLPTESLYAEMMARAGLADELQREYRIMIAGPSNFLALLNIVQMGFRTVAIEQRSSEVWRTLGAVRTEFGKFGEVLNRAQKKMQEASNTIDEARGKTTTIARRLRDVEEVPAPEAARLLGTSSPPDVGDGNGVADDEKH
ncbi:MAG: DNA recombination protein RmuC [Casimicrobiaceae bacterium]